LLELVEQTGSDYAYNILHNLLSLEKSGTFLVC